MNKTVSTYVFGVAVLTLAINVFAGSVTLTWDAPIMPGPAITNYVLTAVSGTNRVSISTGMATLMHVKDLPDGSVWQFEVQSVSSSGALSTPSNVLPIEIPQSSTGLRAILQHTISLNDTNGWSDVGFFKILITK